MGDGLGGVGIVIEFKLGETAQHKSGGPVLVVNGYAQGSRVHVSYWCAAKNEFKETSFLAEELERVVRA